MLSLPAGRALHHHAQKAADINDGVFWQHGHPSASEHPGDSVTGLPS
jgi:hypothetical protein